MFQPDYFGALLIGFFGSLHCIGMCGPIALVTPSFLPGVMGRIISGIVYNGGRTLTYMILGVLAGLIGKGAYFFQWQQGLSIVIGILILLYLAAPHLLHRFSMTGKSLQFTSLVKKSMSSFLKKKSFSGILGIGLVNGLLPCGLVYIALAGSMEQYSVKGGALFMMFFGLGTLPMMGGIYLLGDGFSGKLRSRLNRLLPYFLFFMGILFILRGLGLGIPYISPSMDPHTGDVECNIPSHKHPLP